MERKNRQGASSPSAESDNSPPLDIGNAQSPRSDTPLSPSALSTKTQTVVVDYSKKKRHLQNLEKSPSPPSFDAGTELCACFLPLYKILAELRASQGILRDRIDKLEINMNNILSTMRSSPNDTMVKHFQPTPSLQNHKAKLILSQSHEDIGADNNPPSKKMKLTMDELDAITSLRDLNTM